MEYFHWLKKKTKVKKKVMAMKFDMAKAYDRIKWSFVRSMLTLMRFTLPIVNSIMSCVSTVSYQVLINDQPRKRFSPKRGLRHGNPLSSYLFIFCANVLSRFLNKKEQKNVIYVIRVANNAPKVTHLLPILFRSNGKIGQVKSVI